MIGIGKRRAASQGSAYFSLILSVWILSRSIGIRICMRGKSAGTVRFVAETKRGQCGKVSGGEKRKLSGSAESQRKLSTAAARPLAVSEPTSGQQADPIR